MDRTDAQRIGGRVRQERLARGMTQKQLAERLTDVWLRRYPGHGQITQNWISALEVGLSRLANIERVVMIAEIFDLPTSALLDEDGHETSSNQALRMVLRMHGVPNAVSEDVIREFRLIETQGQSHPVTPAPANPSGSSSATPSPESGTRRRPR